MLDKRLPQQDSQLAGIAFPEVQGNELTLHSLDCIDKTADYRKALIRRLSKALEQRFGIYPSDATESKLSRLFEGSDWLELSNRVIELEGLSGSHGLWLSLVEKLTVHETYFFRDEPQLEMLRKYILPQLIERASRESNSHIRIWSAGCSTGEEVYTLAMLILDAMREAGCALGDEDTAIKPVPGWYVEVLGTDISASALQAARDACYAEAGGLGSFRVIDSRWLRWFESAAVIDTQGVSTQGYCRPKEFVRAITRFDQHNLLHSRGACLFDLVVCRNALIYFEENNKRVAQRHLLNALKPKNFLLLGPADPMLFSECASQYWVDGLVHYVRT